ncbi:hypothetical protein LINPERPRIM_LOCUS3305 [Linum perenne]
MPNRQLQGYQGQSKVRPGHIQGSVGHRWIKEVVVTRGSKSIQVEVLGCVSRYDECVGVWSSGVV